MPIPQYAARRDDNEPEIVDALQAAGWGVCRLNAKGVPDLLLGRAHRHLLMEVVGDAKAKKYRKTRGLTPDQVDFHRSWPGVIHIVRTYQEALEIIAQESQLRPRRA